MPLNLDNVYNAVKRVRDWTKFGDCLLLHNTKLNAIHHQHGSDREACLKEVIKAFLSREGHYEPSWRAVIHALYKARENHIAYNITAYAEPVKGKCVLS